MSVTFVSAPATETETAEQRFVIDGISWDAYVTISDALDEHLGVRIDLLRREVDAGGQISETRLACRASGRACQSHGTGNETPWEDAGQATFRRETMKAGLEGDQDVLPW